MQFVEEEIRQLTASIWESILSLPLEQVEVAPAEGARLMAACVQITGAWQGAVSLTCNADFAARAAVIMFGLGDAPATHLDMQDALGELANMVGGNLKALLPEPCQLSLPTVVDGADWSVHIPRSKVMTRVGMSCMGSPLGVTLLQRELKAA